MRIDYHEYIQSPEWRQIADEAKALASYRCRVCNRHANEVVLNAHHRTYERLGHEDLDDITVLCRACHELYELHGRIPKKPSKQKPVVKTAQPYASPTVVRKITTGGSGLPPITTLYSLPSTTSSTPAKQPAITTAKASPAVPVTKAPYRPTSSDFFAVLAVIILIGIMTGVATLSSRSSSRQPERPRTSAPVATVVQTAKPTPTPKVTTPPKADVIQVDNFSITRDAVTIDQYFYCVAAGVCTEPDDYRWRFGTHGNYAITFVTWYQAQTYAEYVGGRLPTAAEWETACLAGAYGTYNRDYNVWEWTADRYEVDYFLIYDAINCTYSWSQRPEIPSRRLGFRVVFSKP